MTTPATPGADPAANPAPASDPAPSADPKGGQPAATPPANPDPKAVTLTDEQLAAAFEHPRFKELNEKAKRADTLEKEKKAAETKALEEQGKWEEVAKSKDEQLTTMQKAVVTSEIKTVAATLGAVNPSIVANAIDRAEVTVGEDGSITGVSEAVEALKVSDPYLFSNSNQQPHARVGSPTNPGTAPQTGYKFTMTQIKDPAFYKEHRAEIGQAMREGQIDKNN